MAKRKAVPKKTRFEVFKRDSFTCQYCGRKSPDVLLEVDHIEPVSKGGTNAILNLITSCGECNSGKSDRRLADASVLEKQRRQLEELQSRKEQLQMMFEWQKGLQNLKDTVVGQLAEYWSGLVCGWELNETGMTQLRKLSRKFEMAEIMAAMKIATESYLQFMDGELEPTEPSVDMAWGKIGGICFVRRREKENPSETQLYYIRGILRRRIYVNERMVMPLLRKAVAASIDLERLKEFSKDVRSWTQWRAALEEYIDKQSTTQQAE